MRYSAKFQLKRTSATSTSFTTAQLVQKYNGEGGLTLACWIWPKLGIQRLYGCGNMCAKFHSIWELLACTSFTRLSLGKKLRDFGEEDLLSQWGLNLAQHDNMVRIDCTKSLRSNGKI